MALKRKQLGLFARAPVPGSVKSRLSPPLGADDACALYRAFLTDLSRRLERLSGIDITMFWTGEDPALLEGLAPRRAAMAQQQGESLGGRLANAFSTLLDGNRHGAVVIGSDSPDIPIQYVRRAFQKLRHSDVVLGPAADGGYYLVGLREPFPSLFEGISWGSDRVYAQSLEAVARAGRSLSTLPLWYDVDDAEGLRLLRDAVREREIRRRDRLRAVEAALREIDGR